MDIEKKQKPKYNSDLQTNKKNFNSKLNNYLPQDKVKEKPNIKDHLSLSLSNSLKNLASKNSVSKIKASSLYSPKIAAGYLPHASSTKRINRKKSSNSLQMASSVRNYAPNIMPTGQNEIKNFLSPKMALTYFKAELTEYEKTEILDYTEVFYIGKLFNKIRPDISELNFGFDDERGDYLLVAGDHIGYRYEIIKMLGKGNFGQVALCEDHKRKEKIALKIVRNKKRFNQQATVEIKILQTLRENDIEGRNHVVKIKNYFMFRKHICMTFEILSMNLYELLHKNNFEGFSLSLIYKFIYQLLVCLNYAFTFNIIHCDLKPENIMLVDSKRAEISVIDFGSSCFESEKIYTYIQSRFYRAPEIILGIPYTPAIDMWSLGCITAEFFTGYPLFVGESEHDQLLFIIELLGLPPENVLKISTRAKLFFELSGSPRPVANKKTVNRAPGSKKITDVLQGAPEIMIDFVIRCLDWNPQTRMKPSEGLEHPWIAESLKQEAIKKNKNRKKKRSVG
ncbi:hypothetical protein SteCoe_24501 [Stentor coeruleus]|uniref:dual-specificity kinase n=1 Tax=Stentor coeruleus TaxID=5963 RepID=A0A1R2BHB0_9CILI|nr:hypothetical protein SteCoe_24501 [Stentor coeruleus]